MAIGATAAAAGGGGGGGASNQDQSMSSALSGGTFMPTFGAISVPQGNMKTALIYGGVALVAVILWRQL